MYYVCALLWFFNELLYDERRSNVGSAISPSGILSSRARCITALLSAGSLVLLLALSLSLLRHAAADPQTPRALAHLPIPAVYYNSAFWDHPYRTAAAFCLLLTNIGASLALFLLYRSLSTNNVKPIIWGALACAYTACTYLALNAPALDSTDVYRYAVQGALGLKAYASHPLHISCPDPQPDAWCRQHDFMFPSLYGPLYLTYLQALLRRATSILSTIETLRLAGVVWTTLLVALLFFLRIKPAIVAVAALNPVVFLQYVGDAHNDIIGITLITAGVLAVARFPFLTLLLVLAASLVKFPFALIGLCAFIKLAPRPRSYWIAASFAASAGTLWAWNGKAYIASLRLYGQASWTTQHALALALAVVLIGVILSHKRSYLAGAYLLPALSSFAPMPWYALWGLPYLDGDRRKLATFLILLPSTTFLLSTNFVVQAFWYTLLACLFAALFFQIFRKRTTPK